LANGDALGSSTSAWAEVERSNDMPIDVVNDSENARAHIDRPENMSGA
jgi:hypothetical protein